MDVVWSTDIEGDRHRRIPHRKRAPLNNYDREELYEMVWSMPLWQVAEVLGRKAFSISKACVKLYIPIPPHGYWRRHEISRSSISRPPLPNLPSSLIPRPDPQQKHDGPLTVSALLMSRYDRVKIYKEVWTKPIAHLAREKGVSDTTLITRCKQLRIPTPGVDYWQRKAKNLPVPERPPLEPVVVTGYTSNTENWDERNALTGFTISPNHARNRKGIQSKDIPFLAWAMEANNRCGASGPPTD